jgi:hypothetical protein
VSSSLALLQRLREMGGTLRVEEGRLLLDAPKGALDRALLEEIRLHKAELIRLLTTGEPRSPAPIPLKRWDPDAPPEGLSDLRRLCPSLWHVAQTPRGRRALIWGVTARGVIVSFAPNEPLMTIGSLGVELL